MPTKHQDKIEFFGGAATGKFAITAYVLVRMAALVTIVVISIKASSALADIPWSLVLHAL